jgi:hypothetical protein
MSTEDDYTNGYGYSNINFIGNSNNIKSIELSIGGSCVDKIYPKLTGKMTFSIFATNILPALSEDNYEMFIFYSNNNEEPIQLTFDVNKITNPIMDNKFRQIKYESTQFMGEEMIQNICKSGEIIKTNKFRLGFNHLVNKITVISDLKLDDMKLTFNGKHEHSINNSTNEYIFNPPINFSAIDNAVLQINANNYNDKSFLCIFADGPRIACINNDKFGVMFSK